MDSEAIERYSLGNLPDEESAPFDEHLLLCDECRARVEESDAYVAAMRIAAQQIRGQASQPYRGKAPVTRAQHAGGDRRS